MYSIVPLRFLFWLPSMQLSKQGYRPLTVEDTVYLLIAPGYRNATQTCYASHVNNWSFYSSAQILQEHVMHKRPGICCCLGQYAGNPVEAKWTLYGSFLHPRFAKTIGLNMAVEIVGSSKRCSWSKLSYPLQDYLILLAAVCSTVASRFLGNLWKISECPF